MLTMHLLTLLQALELLKHLHLMVQIETVGLAPQLALHRDSCRLIGGDQLLNLKRQHENSIEHTIGWL